MLRIYVFMMSHFYWIKFNGFIRIVGFNLFLETTEAGELSSLGFVLVHRNG